MTMKNIPPAVYLVALDLMGVERPADLTDVGGALRSAEARVSYDRLRLELNDEAVPVSAFGAALAMYVSLSGPFAEEDGEFAGVNGFEAMK